MGKICPRITYCTNICTWNFLYSNQRASKVPPKPIHKSAGTIPAGGGLGLPLSMMAYLASTREY